MGVLELAYEVAGNGIARRSFDPMNTVRYLCAHECKPIRRLG
jgi:hypothetical protein